MLYLIRYFSKTGTLLITSGILLILLTFYNLMLKYIYRDKDRDKIAVNRLLTCFSGVVLFAVSILLSILKEWYYYFHRTPPSVLMDIPVFLLYLISAVIIVIYAYLSYINRKDGTRQQRLDLLKNEETTLIPATRPVIWIFKKKYYKTAMLSIYIIVFIYILSIIAGYYVCHLIK